MEAPQAAFWEPSLPAWETWNLPGMRWIAMTWPSSLEAGLRAVSRQTKARPGDKTMMDALTPAVAAAGAAAGAGKTIPNAMEDAASAARLGAESTRDLVARYGRARSLGERTRGHPDAGATSIALILQRIQRRSEQWQILTMCRTAKTTISIYPTRAPLAGSRGATRWTGG